MSKRAEILSALKTSWAIQSEGRYYVRRGPIDWLHFDFISNPYAVAIVVEASALPIPASFTNQPAAFRTLTVAFEVFQRMPQGAQQPELSEVVQEQLVADIIAVIADMHTRKATDGTPLIDAVETPDDALSDWSDSTIGVQGVVASIPLSYHEVS